MQRRFPAGSLAASFFLATLTTAGVFYVAIMPVLVDGLITGLGLTPRNAGLVAATDVYGAAAGALLSFVTIPRVRWQTLAFALLIALLAADAASLHTRSVISLLVIRIGHGIAGGALTCTGYAVIARSPNAERAFGMVLFVQSLLGSVAVAVLPSAVAAHGATVVFATLMGVSALTLVGLRWAPAAPSIAAIVGETVRFRISRGLLRVMGALYLFQAANVCLSTFLIDLGRAHGLTTRTVSVSLALAFWVAISGGAIAAVVQVRYGRLWPVFFGLTLSIVSSFVLNFGHSGAAFLVGVCGLGTAWTFIVPYLLGTAAVVQPDGRSTVVAGLASKLGLGTGAAAAALLIGDYDYARIVIAAVLAFLGSAVTILPAARRLDDHRDADTSRL